MKGLRTYLSPYESRSIRNSECPGHRLFSSLRSSVRHRHRSPEIRHLWDGGGCRCPLPVPVLSTMMQDHEAELLGHMWKEAESGHRETAVRQRSRKPVLSTSDSHAGWSSIAWMRASCRVITIRNINFHNGICHQVYDASTFRARDIIGGVESVWVSDAPRPARANTALGTPERKSKRIVPIPTVPCPSPRPPLHLFHSILIPFHVFNRKSCLLKG